MEAKIVALIDAVRAADEESGRTNVKPAGQPWKQVYAIPTELWERVRELLSDVPASASKGEG